MGAAISQCVGATPDSQHTGPLQRWSSHRSQPEASALSASDEHGGAQQQRCKKAATVVTAVEPSAELIAAAARLTEAAQRIVAAAAVASAAAAASSSSSTTSTTKPPPPRITAGNLFDSSDDDDDDDGDGSGSGTLTADDIVAKSLAPSTPPASSSVAGAAAHSGASTPPAHDSASSLVLAGSAFLDWAKDAAAAAGVPLDAFLARHCREGSGGADAPDVPADALAPLLPAFGVAVVGAASAAISRSGSSSPRSPPAAPLASAYDGHLRGAPKPGCHDARVAAANGIYALKSARDGEIEAMLRLLTTVFSCETATVALLTGEAIHITAACGALAPGICPDRWGFCGWSFINSNHELLVCEDLDRDKRFAANFFVCDPTFHLKFYIAAPLISSNGHRLGTLCVMGQAPRRFDATRGQVLANLAEMLVRQLEAGWARQLADAAGGAGAAKLARSLSVYDAATLFVDVGGAGCATPGDWRVLHMNGAAAGKLGVSWRASYADLPSLNAGRRARRAWTGVALSELFPAADAVRAEWAPRGSWEFSLRGVEPACGGASLRLRFRRAASDGLDAEQPFCVGVPPWLRAAADGFGATYFFVTVEAEEEGSEYGSCASGSLVSDSTSSGGGRRASVDGSRRASLDASTLPPSGGASGGDSGTNGAAALAAAQRGAVWLPRGVSAAAGCPIPGLVLGPMLGRGGYGRVYRGLYRGEAVAVKIVDDVRTVRRDVASGAPLEASLTGSLHHVGLMRTVTYSDVPTSGGASSSAASPRMWLVFEMCDRGSLGDAVLRGLFRTSRLATEGCTDLRTVAVTAFEVAAGMAALHARGVTHGDLAGGNVMLATSAVNVHGFCAKVGDFGLARRVGPSAKLAANEYGTVTHMAPEVLLRGEAGCAADVYSFGVLLWEMLTGTRAWVGLQSAAVVCQVAVVGRALAMPAGLPAALEQLLAGCLAREPGARPTFAGAAAQLQHFLQTTRGIDLRKGCTVGAPSAEVLADMEAACGCVATDAPPPPAACC